MTVVLKKASSVAPFFLCRNASRPSNDVLDWKELIRTKSPVVLESVTHGEHIFFQVNVLDYI